MGVPSLVDSTRAPAEAGNSAHDGDRVRRDGEEQWRKIPLEALHEINRAEVERILRKLDESGARSLTPDERAFMNRMCGNA